MAAPVNEKNIKIKAFNRLNRLLSAHNINNITLKMVDYVMYCLFIWRFTSLSTLYRSYHDG